MLNFGRQVLFNYAIVFDFQQLHLEENCCFQSILAAADTSGDGKIDKSEFFKYFNSA
jgi:hypothetical protein